MDKPIDIEALETIARAATPGPYRSCWKDPGDTNEKETDFGTEWLIRGAADAEVVGTDYYDGIHVACTEEDADFIVAAVNALPALLAEIKHLRAKVDHMAEEHACHDRFYERDSSCIAWKGTP